MRPVIWIGSSHQDWQTFPGDVQDVMGYALYLAQCGEKANNVKPLIGFKGASVLEITDNLEDAQKELTVMLANSKFGAASQEVVIEEFLDGIELSVFVLTDGENYKLLPTAKDYKRIGEGDKGLNTGGMGAVSPVPFAIARTSLRVTRTGMPWVVSDTIKTRLVNSLTSITWPTTP